MMSSYRLSNPGANHTTETAFMQIIINLQVRSFRPPFAIQSMGSALFAGSRHLSPLKAFRQQLSCEVISLKDKAGPLLGH